MNRFERLVLTATVVLLPVASVIAVLIWSLVQGADFLVGGGSTSVVPMMNDFLRFYRHAEKGYSDILYNAIGSSASLAGIRHGSYQFGFLSKTVDDKLAQQLWTENKVSRFVVARDPVMIIYHIKDHNNIKGPDAFSQSGDDTGQHLIFGNDPVSKTQNNVGLLSKIMQQFYVKHSLWTNVFPNTKPQYLPKKPPKVISREAGSGTREFFEKSILKSDKYTADQYVGSNQLMLDAVNNTDNSIGYLSFEYAKSILSFPKYSKNVAVAAVTFKSGSDPQLPWKPWKSSDKDKVNGNTGYALYRPFTGIFRTTGRNADEILRFVAWMINPYTKDESDSDNGNAVDIIRQHGLFPVFPGDSDGYFQKYNDWSWRSKVASTFQLIKDNFIYQKHQIPGDYKIPPQ